MKTLFSILATCLALATAPLSAATVSGVILEGPNVTNPTGMATDHNLGDFSNSTVIPVLTFSDDAWIFGRVYKGFTDGFTIDATGQSFRLVISLMGQSKSTTKLGMSVNGAAETFHNAPGSSYPSVSTIFDTSGLTGIVTVALRGVNNGNSKWLVDVMDVQAVPVPASALLLLGGLAGFGALRRRKG